MLAEVVLELLDDDGLLVELLLELADLLFEALDLLARLTELFEIWTTVSIVCSTACWTNENNESPSASAYSFHRFLCSRLSTWRSLMVSILPIERR